MDFRVSSSVQSKVTMPRLKLSRPAQEPLPSGFASLSAVAYKDAYSDNRSSISQLQSNSLVRVPFLAQRHTLGRVPLKTVVPLLACLVSLTIGSTISAQSTVPGSGGVPSPGAPGLSASTANAIKAAVSTNLFEIESSKLALARSQSPQVRALAELIVTDHTRTANRGRQVLAATGASMPPAMLEPRHQQQLDALKAASNAEFDRAYIEAQYRTHLEAIALVRDYANTGDNPSLKTLAREILPTLQAHLEQISKLR